MWSVVCVQGNVCICRDWFQSQWTAMTTIDYCIMALALLTLLLVVQRVVPILHGQWLGCEPSICTVCLFVLFSESQCSMCCISSKCCWQSLASSTCLIYSQHILHCNSEKKLPIGVSSYGLLPVAFLSYLTVLLQFFNLVFTYAHSVTVVMPPSLFSV